MPDSAQLMKVSYMAAEKQALKSTDAGHKPQLPDSKATLFAAIRALQVREQAWLGRDSRPSEEPLRLRAKPSLAYPPTEIAQAYVDESGRPNLEVSCLGLFGPSGSLPNIYTQMIIDRSRRKDYSLREFLDLFNHRWLSLFYRAWEKHDYASAFQTAASLGKEDTVTSILWCLIGFGTQGQRQRLRLQDSALLHYSGLLADATPRQSSLQRICADWFAVQVQVLQFQGQWISIPDKELSRPQGVTLGTACHNRLGYDVVAGSRIWNVESRFRVRIGPLTRSQFIEFSPVGERLYELVALVRNYVGPQYDFDVQAIVRRQDVPGSSLGGTGEPSRLGWNTWLGDWPFDRDAGDPVFELDDKLTVRQG